MRNIVKESLDRLRVRSLFGLLLHRPMQLLESRCAKLYEVLDGFKKEGVVDKVGFSIYSPEELDSLWKKFKPDIVQAPFNIFDRRLQTSGWLTRMSNEGIEIHIRSAFLQGLLLMSPSERPKMFTRWSALWSQWDSWIELNQVSPQHACLAHVLSYSEISKVVVGVDSSSQLTDLLESTSVSTIRAPEELQSNDVELLNPSLWL